MNLVDSIAGHSDGSASAVGVCKSDFWAVEGSQPSDQRSVRRQNTSVPAGYEAECLATSIARGNLTELTAYARNFFRLSNFWFFFYNLYFVFVFKYPVLNFAVIFILMSQRNMYNFIQLNIKNF